MAINHKLIQPFLAKTQSVTQKISTNRSLLITITFISCFLILFLRRGNQLISPEVWDEDGTQNLISFIKTGWQFLLVPVNGYLITISKLITGLSASISILYYPEISTYIAWLFQISVGVAVVLSPTHLKYKFLCALAIFLVPTDPEVLGIPLYSFWFSSILLFLVILWDKEKINIYTFLFLLVGGLSSPVVAIVPFFLILRRLLQKDFFNRRVLFILILSLLMTAIQGYYIFIGNASSGLPTIDYQFFYENVKKFVGHYYLGFTDRNRLRFWGGLVLLLFFLYALIKRKFNPTLIVLMMLMGATIALSVSRVEYIYLHPIVAGPRYFFFPFILISWILIYILQGSKYKLVSIFLVMSMFTTLKSFNREHDNLNWRESFYKCSCQEAGGYTIPVHYNGNDFEHWAMNLSSEDCSEIIEDDLFSSSTIDKCNYFFFPSPQFKQKWIDSFKSRITDNHVLDNHYLENGTPSNQGIKNHTVYGSYFQETTNNGHIELKLNRNQSFLIQTGKSSQHQIIEGYTDEGKLIFREKLPLAYNKWIRIKFNHKNLPNSFLIRIKDESIDAEEWNAIML